MAKEFKTGFIGAGKMGSIIIEGILESGLCSAANLSFFEISDERAGEISAKNKITRCASISELVGSSEVVFLCVKPDQFAGIAEEISSAAKEDKTCLVSIMAGVGTEKIKKLIAKDLPVVRVMPNVACVVKKGVAGVAADAKATTEQNEYVYEIFRELGGAVRVLESKMNAVTALSGSGPAYVFMLIEALADAGVKIGLDRGSAVDLAARTVSGAAEMVLQTESNTLDLRAQVTSPGGTTAAGTAVLEKSAFRSALIEAVEAAWKRAIELGG